MIKTFIFKKSKTQRISVHIVACLCFFISFYSCKAQTLDIKEILSDFEKRIYLSEPFSVKELKKFVVLHKNIENSKNLTPLFKYDQEIAKEELEICGENFIILSYKDIDKYPELKKDKLYKKLEYKIKKNVYYSVCLKKNDLRGIYVVNKKGKIISLFPYLHIGADPIVPYMLNKKPKKGDMLFQR